MRRLSPHRSMVLGVLGLAALMGPAIGEGDPCPGCEDNTPTPAPPPPDSHYYGPDLRGTATYTITITQDSGACCIEELEVGGNTINVCRQKTPCTPKVTTKAILDGDIAFTTEHWRIEGSGSYGHSSQDNYEVEETNDVTVTLFDSDVAVGCGEELGADVTYTITFYLLDIFGGEAVEDVWTPNFKFDFDCEKCALKGL